MAHHKHSGVRYFVYRYFIPVSLLAKTTPREFEPTVRKETSFGRIFKDFYVVEYFFGGLHGDVYIQPILPFKTLINEQYPDQRELTNFWPTSTEVYIFEPYYADVCNDKIIANYGIKVSLLSSL